MSDLGMFDLLKWAGWMCAVTFCILVLRAIFHKPPSVPNKRWLTVTTPELIQTAFTTNAMYGVGEKMAKTHLERYGVDGWISLYSALFYEYLDDPTTDGYRITGSITDMGNEMVRLIFELERNGEHTHYLYEVSYLHLARVTDTLSPTLLGRLDWHKKKIRSINGG